MMMTSVTKKDDAMMSVNLKIPSVWPCVCENKSDSNSIINESGIHNDNMVKAIDKFRE